MRTVDPLKLLRRTDKWYLGGGNRLIWTPAFPVWLDRPGFWDEAHYYNFTLAPVFTWTLLDEHGEEIELTAAGRTWDPSRLESRLRTRSGPHGLGVRESRCCLPNDVLCSRVELRNRSRKPLTVHLIAWSVQPGAADVRYRDGAVSFSRRLTSGGDRVRTVHCAFGTDTPAASHAVTGSEPAELRPDWRYSPFASTFRNGRLPGSENSGGSHIHIGLHRSIRLRGMGRAAVSVLFAAAPSAAQALSDLAAAARQDDPVRLSAQNWLEFFSTVPAFACADAALTQYYWYRWYGLRLMTIDPHEGNYSHPAVCEGIGYFRAPISYSAPCHMLENRWRHDPALAQGSLLTFIDHQREDGGFRGYLDVEGYRQEMFYHANWGRALRELHALHPDRDFLKSVYPGLKRYAEYFDRERDREGSGLYDIANHYETGQEYMHRYMAVAPGADREHWGNVFRLKGVDVTVYLYELKQTLAWIAAELGAPAGETAAFRTGAEKIRRAVLDRMWDPAEEMFFDVDPATGRRTGVKALTCFYPYMTDIVERRHLAGLTRHLFNPREFWTRFPAPSSSADDPYYSPDAEWNGERKNCPWNGRVWPMTNSHIAAALWNCAGRFGNAGLRKKALAFTGTFVRMMFSGPGRPNSYEHYHPDTGQPSLYRGVDDYQHSWVNDLMLRHIAGVQVEGAKVVIRPAGHLPVEVRDLVVAGASIRFRAERTGITVWVNGKRRATAAREVTISLPPG